MTKFMKLMAAAGLAVSLGSCASSKTQSESPSVVGKWNIVAVEGERVSGAEKDPYIQFGTDNRMNGCAGCNQMMGSYTVDSIKQTLTFDHVGSTRMMCRDMKTEDAVLSAIGKVKAYRTEDGHLILVDEAGTSLLTLEKSDK